MRKEGSKECLCEQLGDAFASSVHACMFRSGDVRFEEPAWYGRMGKSGWPIFGLNGIKDLGGKHLFE